MSNSKYDMRDCGKRPFDTVFTHVVASKCAVGNGTSCETETVIHSRLFDPDTEF